MEIGTTAEAPRRRECHETTTVTVGERSAQIDVELAGIIESLWKLGINTRACCQDQSAGLKRHVAEPRGYILFQFTGDLQRFLELLQGTPIAEHRWQNFEWSDGVGSPLVEITPIGWSYGINVRRPGPKRDGIEIGASVKFPVEDIPLLESALTVILCDRRKV